MIRGTTTGPIVIAPQTTPHPAAMRAAQKIEGEWSGEAGHVERDAAIITRECLLDETADVLRAVCREPSSLANGGTDSNGNWVVRLTAAEIAKARDLLSKME